MTGQATTLGPGRGAAVLTFLAVAAAAGAGPAEPTFEQVFDKTAGLAGRDYAVLRDLLAANAAGHADLLKRKADADDWRARDLAAALLLTAGRPGEVALLRQGLRSHRHELDLSVRGRARFVARDRPDEADPRPRTPDGLTFGREMVPALIDVLRETVAEANQGGSGPEVRAHARCMRALGHLADPRATHALLAYGGRDPVDALAAIGPPALDVLRAVASQADPEEGLGWRGEVGRRCIAVAAYGRVVPAGDEAAARLLTARLAETRHPRLMVALCQALGRVGRADSVEPVFRQLCAAAAGWPGREMIGNDDPEDAYPDIRRGLLAFGKTAGPYLQGMARDGTPLERGPAAGVLYELREPAAMEAFLRAYGRRLVQLGLGYGHSRDRSDAALLRAARMGLWSHHGLNGELVAGLEVPKPLRLERAAAPVLRTTDDLLPLAGAKDDPLAFSLLAEAIRHPYARRSRRVDRAALLRVLAQTGNPRAIGVLRDVATRKSGLIGPELVEAALRLGGPEAAGVLRQVLSQREALLKANKKRYAPVLELAEAVLPAVEGGAKELAKLLTAEHAGLRLVAARQLAARGDLRGLAILTAGAATAGRAEHAQIRDVLVAAGRAAVEPLRRRMTATDEPHEKLFCEAVLLRIARPELVDKLRQASLLLAPGFHNHAGPRAEDYRQTGRAVAGLVGKEAVPLLEAAVVWGGPIQPDIAVFALATFRQERSIAIIAGHFPASGWVRQEGLAALALSEFGEKGAAAAEQVRQRARRNAERVSRHRGATATLAELGDVKGLEGIAEGLALAAQDKIETWRTNIYLKLALKYEDPDRTLLAATLAALSAQGGRVAEGALRVLARYKDKRILPACLRYLGAQWRTGNLALVGVIAAKGTDTPHLLVDRASAAETESDRVGAVRAIGNLLGNHADRFALAKMYEPPRWEQVQDELRDAALKLLAADSEAVQWEAALQLAKAVRHPKIDAALLPWLAAHPRRMGEDEIVRYLRACRHESVERIVLAAYRTSSHTSLARILGERHYEPATKSIAAALCRRAAAAKPWTRYPEAESLCRIGESGRRAAHRIFRGTMNLPARVQIAHALSQRGYKPVADEVQALFRETTMAAVWTQPDEDEAAKARKKRYRGHVHMLAEALICQDKERAYRELVRACVVLDDAEARRNLAYRIERLRADYPHLAQMPLTLHAAGGDPSAPAPAGSRDR